MKKVIIFLAILCGLCVSSQGQSFSLKVIVLNEVIEIVPQDRDENADFQILEIKSKGKIIKKFAAGASLPQIIGTFNGIDAEYVLYRADMGSGICAGGTVYVIKFATKYNTQTGEENIDHVNVSPGLTACLGEFPFFALSYTSKGIFLLNIAGHTINLDLMDKWIEIKKPVVKKKNESSKKVV